MWVVEVIAGRVGASRLFAGRLLANVAVFGCSGMSDLRSGSRLSSFTLETARALFPPLGSHLGLLKKVLVTVRSGLMADAIGLEHILTFA